MCLYVSGESVAVYANLIHVEVMHEGVGGKVCAHVDPIHGCGGV